MPMEVPGLVGESLVSEAEYQMILRRLPDSAAVLELGTWQGVTAARLAKDRPDCTVTSVDYFGGGRHCLEKWFDNHQPNQALLVADIADAPAHLSGPFDVAIVDGSHDEESAHRDLLVALCFDAKVIFAHDYEDLVNEDRGVKPAVERFCGECGFTVAEVADMMAVLVRGEVRRP